LVNRLARIAGSKQFTWEKTRITEMSDEQIDTIVPWTIKAIPVEIKDRAIAAARSENVTVGQWLTRRIEEWLADGGPTVQATFGTAAWADLLRAAADAANAGLTGPAQEVAALVRGQVRQARGLPPLKRPAKPQRLAAPEAPDQEAR